MVIEYFNKAIETDNSKKTVLTLAKKSCHILSESALVFRRYLARNGLISLREILEEKRCRQTSSKPFEKGFVKLPITNIYFYREKNEPFIQFLDSLAPLSMTRGFESKYIWKLSFSNGGKIISRGEHIESTGKDSIKINLNQTSNNKFKIPFGKKLFLEITTKRNHSKTFIAFDSKPAQVQFVSQPWFNYFPQKKIEPKVVYPLSQLHLQKN